MTQDEMIALGKQCLTEYESKLNALGSIQPYSGRAVKAMRSFTDPLHSIDERRMRSEISKVLDELAAVKQGFRMSEPNRALKEFFEVKTIRHGNLNVSFVTTFDSTNLETITHVVCWYYPG